LTIPQKHRRKQLSDSKARIPKTGNGGAKKKKTKDAINPGERPEADIMK